MLTVSKMGAKSACYYADLAQEQGEFDASKSGEPPGQWLGQGSAWFGLSGHVRREDFLALFQGFSPDGQALLSNAGQQNHCPGWDLTFSAVKSVGGLLWAVAPPDIRETIESCHHWAMQRAIAYLENQSSNRDGEPCRLVIAGFQHGSNRNRDPGLHTHCLVLNIAIPSHKSDRSRPLNSKPLYQHKLAAGALYRSEFAYLLQQELGLQLERVQRWFELQSFSRENGPHQDLMNHWSSRRQEIEAQGPVNARHAQLLAYQTRNSKGIVPPRNELFAEWQHTAQEYGFTQKQTLQLVKEPRQLSTLSNKWAEWRTTREAAQAVIRHTSHFTHREMVQAMAEASQTRQVSADQVMALTERYLASRHVIHLGMIDGQYRYANKRLYRLEQKLLAQAHTLAQSRGFRIRQSTVTHAANHHGLRPEQEQALITVTRPSRLTVLSGITGTGKTHTLDALRQAYRDSGYEVLGVAVSRRGAEKLQERTELRNPNRWGKRVLGQSDQAISLYSLFARIDRAQESKRKYGSRSVVRSPLSNRTVVMLDDSQRISTTQMNRLVKEVNRAGAKLILSGDLKQPQSYEHRGAFAALAQRIGHSELTQVIRQDQQHARSMVQQVSQGQTRPVVQQLIEQGQLTFAKDKAEALSRTVHNWGQQGTHHPRQHLMITETRDDAQALNQLAQQARVEEGILSQVAVKVRRQPFYKGDRVRFTQTSHTYGVTSGTLGTLKHLDTVTRMAVVKLDSGKTRLINTRSYRGMELGYAITTTAAQDLEVSHAYVMAHGDGREAALVQLSRSHQSTQVVAYGQGLEQEQEQHLAEQLQWSKLKELAAIAEERVQEQEQEQEWEWEQGR